MSTTKKKSAKPLKGVPAYSTITLTNKDVVKVHTLKRKEPLAQLSSAQEKKEHPLRARLRDRFVKDGLTPEQRVSNAVLGYKKFEGLPPELRTEKQFLLDFASIEKYVKDLLCDKSPAAKSKKQPLAKRKDFSVARSLNGGRTIPVLPQKTIDYIIASWRKGMSFEKIAKTIHRSTHTVSFYAQGKHNLPLKTVLADKAKARAAKSKKTSKEKN